MATTATTTQTSTNSLSILADYELHHSGSEEPQSSERARISQAAQPTNWPSNYRRVPAYRPANHELDYSERPAGSNRGEFVFIQVMLHGSVARLWRFTGGRINDRIFRYDIGGEF
ncbi:hypothetical protein CNMCM5623_006015 [Aspergillus felis]|uniref:Uncharacterized protein n=1 Tax=Aspergillus felis TaxID=1287682 RepID=A0A8H6V3B6_9EURO|nr:hypothetical protein CNMCM5623_006015 [Aspergillus felis]KAF7184483.1 hypothetical protein CNMCM7691_005551 [Aspergillus felis]